METPIVTLDCGHVNTPTDLTPGYATDRETGKTLCYSCAADAERVAFAASDVYGGYISTDASAPYPSMVSGGTAGNLTTWTGEVLAKITEHGASPDGFHGSPIHYYRFRDDSGAEWYGKNGGPGMAVTVRRAKGRR